MSQPAVRVCASCAMPLSATARYCSRCGTPVEAAEPDAVWVPGNKRLRVEHDTLSLRELLSMVEAGVSWWQQRLKEDAGVNREQAAAAIKELSQILESLAQQIAQGRETVRITARLPALRTAPMACPVCGRGNRAGARFCLACGTLLPDPNEPRPETAKRVGLRLQVAARTDRGQVRRRNEDLCYAGQLTAADEVLATLLLVADGMGGERAGDEASRIAGETVKRELVQAVQARQPNDDEGWQALLRQVAVSANRQVYDYARANRDKQGMGTTLTLVVVAGERAHIAHIGDSRAYLINANGVTEDGAVLMQLTLDHSLVARLVDIGQLTPEQARTHPHRNVLYRSLGADPQVEVDTSSQTLGAGDMLLLCSDGLTNHVEDAELAQIALAASSPEAACEQLVALANRRGGLDNISVVVARATTPGGGRTTPARP